MKHLFTCLAVLLGFQLIAQPSGWLYNQPVTVSNPNTVNAVDYQLKLTINTQSLISAGKMTSTGSDIRFGGTCAGTSFFNYWIEGGINTSTTTIWVKVPFIAANSNTTIFMYYGNPSAAAASTIQGTFRGPNSATDSVSGGTSGGLTVCQRGFRFAPNQNILVTHFGKNEPSGTTRYVTLFNYSTQAILSQTQVSGPAASYTYGPIASPLWLTSGTQYVLQIYGLSTDGYYYGTSSQIGQHLTYYDMQYSNGGTQNTFPTNTLANYHYGYGDLLYYVTNTLVTTPTYSFSQLANINSTSVSICSGNSTTLTTSASGSFTWSTGSTATAIVVAPGTTTSYYVSQASPSLCTIAAITISVSAGSPTLSIINTNTQVCQGKTATLTASGALSYTWTGGVVNGTSFMPSVTSSYTVTGQNGCGTSTAVTSISIAPIPVTIASTPTLICAGTPANLSATAAATSFSWSPSNLTGVNVIVSPTTTTIYTVTVSDGTCSGTAIVSLSVNPVPTLNISASSSVICQGDVVNLAAAGAINYTWTPGGTTGSALSASPMVPTLFSVIGINSFNCTSGISQPIIVNPTPTVSAVTVQTLVCSGGGATLTAGGGSDSYVWSTSAAGASLVVHPQVTTVYTVIGMYTLSGCLSAQTITVNVFQPSVSISPSTASACVGSVLSLTATGGSSYNWSPGGSPFPITTLTLNTPTSYTVSALTNSNGVICTSSANIFIDAFPNPTVTASSTRTSICKGEKTIITAGGASTYTWSTNAITPTIQVAPTGGSPYYSVQGMNANGCVNGATIQIAVKPCTQIDELSSRVNTNLKIYPNPSNGVFTLETAIDLNLQLVNELGQLVKILNFTEQNNHTLIVNDLAEGIYFVVGEYETTKIHQKVIVTK